jgi:hypothetical protein
VKQLDAFAGKIGKIANFGVGSILGGGAAAGFAADMQQRIGKLGDVKKEAAIAGTSITDFMKLTGKLGAEDSAKASVGLSRMARNMAELSTGSVEMKTKLENAGLDAVAMKSMGVADATRLVAQRFNEASSAIAKAAIVNAAFGKTGAEMIPVLDKMRGDEIGGKFKGMDAGDVLAAAETKKLLGAGGRLKDQILDNTAGAFAKTGLMWKDVFAGDFSFGSLRGVKGEAMADAARAADSKAAAAMEEAAKLAKGLADAAEAAKKFELSLTIQNPFASPLTPNKNRFRAFETEQWARFGEQGLDVPADVRARNGGLLEKADKADVNAFNASLLNQVKAFELQAQAVGKSAQQMAVLKAKQDALFADPDRLFGAFDKNMAGLERAANAAEAAGMLQGTQSPLQKFREEVKRLDKVGGGLMPQEYDKILGSLGAGLVQSNRHLLPGSLAAPTGAEFGTLEAANEELKFQRADRLEPKNAQEELKAVLDVLAKQEQANGGYLAEIAQAMRSAEAREVISAGDLLGR